MPDVGLGSKVEYLPNCTGLGLDLQHYTTKNKEKEKGKAGILYWPLMRYLNGQFIVLVFYKKATCV